MIRTATTHAVLAALLGASLLLGAPGAAEAKEKQKERWSSGERKGHRVERSYRKGRHEGHDRVVRERVVRRDSGDRSVRRERVVRRDSGDRIVRRERVVRRDSGDRIVRRDRVRSGDRIYRDRDRVVVRDRTTRYEPSRRGFTKQWRSWQGRRVYRDVIVIRDASRGPRYRAWRSYCAPEFNYATRVVYVRPVRFCVSASAIIGSVRIGASYSDCDYLYGCNFCDLRFSHYSHYYHHIDACSHRPHGYRVVCSDWDAPSNGGWWDDRHWQGGADYDDEYYEDDEYYSDRY